jgi:phage tail sheath protein FI
MNSTNSSPGVYVAEHDYSQNTQRSVATVAVIVGEAKRGPVGERTLITSESEYVSTFGKPDATIGWMGHSAIAYLNEGDRLYVTRVQPEAEYGGCTIGWDGQFNTSQTWAGGESDPENVTLAASDLFAIYAINPGDWNSELFIRVYPNTKIGGGYFYLEVYILGAAQPVEKWHCHLNNVVDGYGQQLNIAQQVNRRSKYIRVVQNMTQLDFVVNQNRQLVNTFDAGGVANQPGIQLKGGVNGRRPTIGEQILALDLYADPEYIDINLLINGGITDPDFQMAMDTLCKDRMDCVAILDVPSDMQGVQDAIAFRRDTLHLDSSYSALYSPDVLAADQYNDIRLYVPPSGFVAAAYARTDRDYESWFAPAGMIRGDLTVAGVREVYNQAKRDALYESQVNAIRVIEGSGIKIWGADTLQVMPSALSNMSVRRLMIVIETTIANQLLYGVFDPNDQLLRSKIETACRGFLLGLKNARGLYAFEAICNDSNNPPASIAAGDLYVDLWCDPVLPTKRIVFNAVINKTGVKVTGA